MEFIKDQEKRILLSAISREERVIKEHKELAELIPVVKQLEFYFMYDRLFKKIYNQALEDLQKMIDSEYYDGGYGDYHEVEMISRMIEKLKKQNF